MAFFAQDSLLGEDWSAWRGPTNDGVSRTAKPPIHWSADSNIAWKTETPGIGHGSPIVSGDRIFITACNPDENARLIVCYDRATGQELWQLPVARSPIEQMHPKNTPASSTPATDGERVVSTFAVDDGYFVACVNFDGKLLWKRRLASFVSRHGFHSCPILYDGSVLLAGLQDSDESFVARIDIVTGDTIWHTNTETEIRSFSPPHISDVDGRAIAVVSGANCTTAVDLATGQHVWRIPGPAEKTVSSIVEANGRLFVAGGREKQLLAIDLVDSTQAEVAWKSSAGVPYISSPIIAGGTLHQVSDQGIYSRIDLKSGETLDKRRLLGPTSASPLFAGGHLYLTDESGRTLVASVSPKFEIVAENTIDEPVFASPAVVGHELFLRSDRNVYCVRRTVRSARFPLPQIDTTSWATIAFSTIPHDVWITAAGIGL